MTADGRKNASEWIAEYLSGTITETELVSGCLPHTHDWVSALTTSNLSHLIPTVQKIVDLMGSGNRHSVFSKRPR